MTDDARAAALVRPWWRRARLWLGVGAVVCIGAVLVGTLAQHPGRPLDPASTQRDGSKALIRLLAHFGASVTTTSSTSRAAHRGNGAAVVVTAPNDYSDAQLRTLSQAVARLVLIRPDTRAAAALRSGIEPDTSLAALDPPGCGDAGALAAGSVSFPDDALTYRARRSDATACYGGALLVAPHLAVLGSSALLQNDHLARTGVAALDINAITDSRRLASVVWLTPGGDADGPGPASIWQLFPPAAHRAFWWLLVVGVLLAVWRARRLGAVVAEPLPVVVRSAELVEGHGRLYLRAGARERAAAALRGAVVGRLTHRLGLPRGATAEQVAAAAAAVGGRAPGQVHALLAGPVPSDDAALARLAHDLDRLEAGLQEGIGTR